MSETPVNMADTHASELSDARLRQRYVRHVLFHASEAPAAPPSDFGTEEPRLQFNLRNRSTQIAPHVYEVVLELTLTCVCGQRTLYRAEVHQAGIFELTQSGTAARGPLHTCCPRVLFPFAQQLAGNLVHAGGFLPFQLPAMDFNARYTRYQNEQVDSQPLLKLQQFWKAVTRLQEAGAASPRPVDFRSIHADALAVAQLSRDALPAADQVLAQAPEQALTLEMLGAVYIMNQAQQRAVEVYRCAVSAQPAGARAHYNLATSLLFTGDLAGSEREIATCIDCQSTYWDAYAVRSKVRRYSAQRNHIGELHALLKRFGDQSQPRERLNMALAKEYDDLGDYARAFEHLAEGNAAGKTRRRYDIRRDEAVFDALMRHAPTARSSASGYASDEPIFVFGMPRSGTTLVERILSSHPGASSAGELKQFGMLLKCMSDSPTAALIDADTITRSGSINWNQLGERYLANTRPLTGQTPHFIDKFPQHFLYAGHIANALPQARMICVRRNPMDTCLGNYREVFAETSPFHGYACDLLDTGRYYVLFDRLMAYWQRAFPSRILEVSYESLVADQEAETRTMLDFCGLSWDPACLAFEKNLAPVATASAAQVRAPMNSSAVGRWKHYAGQLTPLRDLLIQAGVAVPLP